MGKEDTAGTGRGTSACGAQQVSLDISSNQPLSYSGPVRLSGSFLGGAADHRDPKASEKHKKKHSLSYGAWT
ncbi:hypothetical protein CCHR01_11827 [Colletotrichum chrysophilum]|uniref:Uncharacterized protein n=1 Tax=Colletotrichum chrysophilum TaxID=1836956 RepID=A0AAD9AEK4_9PEZI|nr:hypothetical protein CCHR01_11827 [Colletotrichum chrysophilum]